MFLLLAAMSAQVANPECSQFESQVPQPIQVKIGRMSADQITPDAISMPREHAWEPRNYRVGKLVYQGTGYLYSSDDPRFELVKAGIEDQANAVCQYGIVLPAGYDAAQGKDVAEGRITFFRLSAAAEQPEGPKEADQIGVKPELSGYVVVASCPIYSSQKKILIALMKPKRLGLARNTIIVASSMKRGKDPSIVLAKLSGNFGSIAVLPNLHGTDWGVSLIGQGAGRSLKTISLRIDGETVNQLIAQLGAPTQ